MLFKPVVHTFIHLNEPQINMELSTLKYVVPSLFKHLKGIQNIEMYSMCFYIADVQPHNVPQWSCRSANLICACFYRPGHLFPLQIWQRTI